MNRNLLFYPLVTLIVVVLALSACTLTQAAPTSAPVEGTLPPLPPLPTERPEAVREAAIAAIRIFEGDPRLAVTYQNTGRHSENSLMVVENYESADTTYMVDVPTNMVVYMQRKNPQSVQPGGAQLSEAELEEMVREWLTVRNPCFRDAESLLVFQPGAKTDNVFFRWQAPQIDPNRPWDQPTFIQVGVTISGAIFGYVDAGICRLVTQ